MNSKNNTLADLRRAAGVSLKDLAYLIHVDAAHLHKVEVGQRRPSLAIILTYHMLFRAPFEVMFADLYAHLHAQLLDRSQRLIENLERLRSPKSSDRIKSLQKLVKPLIHGDEYE